jgi:hypothetical protein
MFGEMEEARRAGIGRRGEMRLITGDVKVRIRRTGFFGWLLTLLSSASISELLEAAANLLGCSSLASLLKDPVRDKPVAEGEATQKARLPGVVGLVVLKPCMGHQKKL